MSDDIVAEKEEVQEEVVNDSGTESVPEVGQSESESVAKTVNEAVLSKNETKSISSAAEEDALDTEQVVVFELAGEEYAVPILDVQEIIPTGNITPFPNVPAYIAGIINVRGTVATVINLVTKFSLNREPTQEKVDQYIILTNVAKALFGIMVDEVSSVTKIPRNNIKEATGAMKSNIHANYIQGVAVFEDRVILILDLAKILSEEEIMNVAEAAESMKPEDSKV